MLSERLIIKDIVITYSPTVRNFFHFLTLSALARKKKKEKKKEKQSKTDDGTTGKGTFKS